MLNVYFQNQIHADTLSVSHTVGEFSISNLLSSKRAYVQLQLEADSVSPIYLYVLSVITTQKCSQISVIFSECDI